jgi:ABC-type nitrate/sulfonate/bicarbonate transport system substrate-binding protein
MSNPFFRRRGARVALAGVAITASLSLAACGGSSEDEAPSGDGAAASYGELDLQLSWIKNEEFAGEFFADSEGYYTEAGFDAVNMTAGPSTGAAELLSGDADIALSDAVSIGTVVADDAPLKIIGATFQKNPFTILSTADGGNIQTAEDMVGKKIGVQDSNTSLFQALLAANDLTEDDVEIVPVGYDPSVLVSGEVDGFVAYLTNEAITVAAQGIETVNLPFADNGLPFVAETVTTTDELIGSDREMLKAFLVAEIKGWAQAVSDPEAAANLALEVGTEEAVPDIDNSIAGATAQAELIVTDETDANGLFTISDTLQEETIGSLANAGIEVSAEDLFDMSLLTEVYEENPDLVDYSSL